MSDPAAEDTGDPGGSVAALIGAFRKALNDLAVLLISVESVLTDRVGELASPSADPRLVELAHRYLGAAGETASAEIRDAIEAADAAGYACERCGGELCSECSRCPAQGCWECDCGRRHLDEDDDRDFEDDDD
jgi:hypothetical protein